MLEQRYYDDINPLGGDFGLFVPNVPPSHDFFAVVKHGDYKGTLILIDTLGRLKEYYGGEYLVTKDERYLFSVYFSDGRGLEVIDLSTGKSVFRKETFPYANKWYISGQTYFFTSESVPDSVFVWDSIGCSFQARTLTQNTMASSHNLEMTFYPSGDYNDCSCDK